MNTKLDKIFAEISAGELVDKITILEIKKLKIQNKDKLTEVEKELKSLNLTFEKFIPQKDIINDLIQKLKSINLKLWDIEDGKRLAEKNSDFGKNFTELARNVYKFNDERAKIKLLINVTLGSNIKEIKSYE
jgi:phenylalanyl-tRNA synthetase alpha subunit